MPVRSKGTHCSGIANVWHCSPAQAGLIGIFSSLLTALIIPFLIPDLSMEDDVPKPEPSPEELRLLTNGSPLFGEEDF